MKSKHAGPLKPDERFGDGWLESKAIPIPFLDGKKLKVLFVDMPDDAAPNEFDAALGAFLKLSKKERLEASEAVYANYTDYRDSTDFSGPPIKKAADVWKHVDFTRVTVERNPHADKKVYVLLKGNCSWEEEHGLQLVFREGIELARISDQDGHVT